MHRGIDCVPFADDDTLELFDKMDELSTPTEVLLNDTTLFHLDPVTRAATTFAWSAVVTTSTTVRCCNPSRFKSLPRGKRPCAQHKGSATSVPAACCACPCRTRNIVKGRRSKDSIKNVNKSTNQLCSQAPADRIKM